MACINIRKQNWEISAITGSKVIEHSAFFSYSMPRPYSNPMRVCSIGIFHQRGIYARKYSTKWNRFQSKNILNSQYQFSMFHGFVNFYAVSARMWKMHLECKRTVDEAIFSFSSMTFGYRLICMLFRLIESLIRKTIPNSHSVQ